MELQTASWKGSDSTDASWSSRPPDSYVSELTDAVISRASLEMSTPKSMAKGYLSDSLRRNPPPPQPTSSTAPSIDLGSFDRQNSHSGT